MSPGFFLTEQGRYLSTQELIGRRDADVERTVIVREEKVERATVAALQNIFGDAFLADFDVRLWNGERLRCSSAPQFTLCLNTPSALRAALTPPVDLNGGRAFVDGALDVDGDLECAVDALNAAIDRVDPVRAARITADLLRLPKPPPADHRGQAALRGLLHSRNRDRDAVRFHYDHPIEFYQTFLDDNLVYSCAYFSDVGMTLTQAQTAKIDYVLRKVRLRPEERLLDIGCGWGALVVRAAEKFGARATGITLSRTQHAEANRRIAELGLSSRARVELWDYRELPPGDPFDKAVSIGMFEHVGAGMLERYFSAAYAALRPGGLFLNHGIAASEFGDRKQKKNGFIERYVFPDGDLVPISDGLRCAERSGFEVRDVESLREHYAMTLRRWVSNLERNESAAVAAAGVTAFRTWRLYMAASANSFRRGRISVFQSLLAKPHPDGSVDLPSTRCDLYASG